MAAQFHRWPAAAADVAGEAAEIAVVAAGAAVIRNPFNKQNGDAMCSRFYLGHCPRSNERHWPG